MRFSVFIEDDTAREVAVRVLTARGHKAWPPLEGDTAPERRPELVIVEARGDGAEAAQMCRTRSGEGEHGPGAIVVVVAPPTHLEAAARAVDAGARDVWLMPLSEAETTLRIVLAERAVHSRERERARIDEMRDSEERYRALSEATFEAVALHENGTILDVNDGFTQMFRCTREQAIGTSAIAMAAPESVATVVDHIRTGRTDPYEAVGIRRDGTTFTGLLRVRTVIYRGREVRVVALSDLTQLQAIEAARRSSEESLAATLRSIGDAVIATDGEGRVERMNPVAERLTGYTLDEAHGRPVEEVFAIVNEETGRPEQSPVRRVLRDGVVVALANHTCLKAKDGSQRPIADSGAPIRDKQGVIRGVVLVFRDQTEERRATEALVRSRAELEQLIESMPDGVVIHRNGTILYANRAVGVALGYENGRGLAGRRVLDYIDAPDQGAVRERLDTVERGQPVGVRETRFRARDGSTVVLEVKPGPDVTFHGERAIVVIARDARERTQILARLQLADRMASLGTLAAGVAHEINNPLAYVDANLTYLERQFHKLISAPDARDERGTRGAQKIEDALREARDGLERVARIVTDLRAFSRGSDGDGAGPADVREVLENTVKMAWNQIRHRGRLVQNLSPVPLVAASPDRLGQVFLNLLVNAVQALDEGAVDANEIGIATFVDPKGRVVVEVKDSGRGIAPEHLTRLFDPFFTTKPQGVGTGLGLAICHGLVTSVGGEIQVTSKLGAGSAFRVYLPVATGESTPRLAKHVVVEPKGRRANVLILDDEPMIVTAAARLLEDDHDVTPMTSPRDTLARIAEGERFDVIFCDLMMPELTGMEFYAQVRALAPEMAERIVFLTGGAFTPSARAFLENVPNDRLEKPFSFAALDRIVRSRAR